MYKLITFTNPMGSIIGSNPNKHPDTVIFGTTSIRSMVTADYRCGPTTNGYKGGVKIATVPSVLKMFF